MIEAISKIVDDNKQTQTVVVVGLGLIGGSVALALSATGRYEVLGIERDADTVRAALEKGAVTRCGDATLLGEADMVILALSPRGSVAFLREHIAQIQKGALVTDVCGVKTPVVAAAEPLCLANGLRFVGGHPMAGKERNGFVNADGALFQRANYLIATTPNSDPAAVEQVKTLAADLGCRNVVMTTPRDHDEIIAFTSQLPHVLAGAYVKSARCDRQHGFTGGSYQDVSRVATVDENLWTDLFLLNKEHLLTEIDDLIDHLTAYRTAIAADDTDALMDTIRRGREIKQIQNRKETSV